MLEKAVLDEVLGRIAAGTIDRAYASSGIFPDLLQVVKHLAVPYVCDRRYLKDGEVFNLRSEDGGPIGYYRGQSRWTFMTLQVPLDVTGMAELCAEEVRVNTDKDAGDRNLQVLAVEAAGYAIEQLGRLKTQKYRINYFEVVGQDSTCYVVTRVGNGDWTVEGMVGPVLPVVRGKTYEEALDSYFGACIAHAPGLSEEELGRIDALVRSRIRNFRRRESRKQKAA